MFSRLHCADRIVNTLPVSGRPLTPGAAIRNPSFARSTRPAGNKTSCTPTGKFPISAVVLRLKLQLRRRVSNKQCRTGSRADVGLGGLKYNPCQLHRLVLCNEISGTSSRLEVERKKTEGEVVVVAVAATLRIGGKNGD